MACASFNLLQPHSPLQSLDFETARNSFDFLGKMKVEGPALLEALEGWCDKQVGCNEVLGKGAGHCLWAFVNCYPNQDIHGA